MMTNLISRYSTRLLAFVLGLSTGVLLSCSNNPIKSEFVAQLIRNNNIEMGSELPILWHGYTVTEGDTVYSCLWTDEESNSPSRSLMIDLAAEDGNREGAWWIQSVNIEPGKYRGMDLELEAAIMLKNVIGYGASMTITTTNSSGRLLQAVSTEGQHSLLGTRYWRTSSLRLRNLSSQTRRISVYLGLTRHANGTVYFDDITLSVFK